MFNEGVDIVAGYVVQQLGRPFDVIRAEATSGDAVECAELHSLKKSFGLDVDTHDEATCTTLCRAWAARHQLFLDQYRANVGMWDDSLVVSFVENPDIAALGAEATPATMKRIRALRNTLPRFIDV